MSWLLSHILFPATFITVFAVALYGIDQQISGGLILAGITIGTILVVAVFERILPEHPEWNQSQDDVGTDLLHGAISMVILPPLLEFGLRMLLLGLATQLVGLVGFDLWPHDWPLLLQLIPAMLISQFGEYWAHRSLHEHPFLWRFHAIHHSPGRLYFLNAARFHPLDAALLLTVALTPLLLLGANPEVMLLYTIWVSVHGLFQHCNIRLRLGPLNHLFSMAELHRWHHSLCLEEASANYGNNLLFWDLIFGTVYYPRDRMASRHIGLSDMPVFPKTYLAQLQAPWRWQQIQGRSRDSAD